MVSITDQVIVGITWNFFKFNSTKHIGCCDGEITRSFVIVLLNVIVLFLLCKNEQPNMPIYFDSCVATEPLVTISQIKLFLMKVHQKEWMGSCE